MFAPSFDIGIGPGLAMRTAFGPWQAGWDAAIVGVYYWTLRRAYGRLLLPGKLFEIYQQRQREAFEVNDTIVQSLVTAQAAQRAGNDELLNRGDRGGQHARLGTADLRHYPSFATAVVARRMLTTRQPRDEALVGFTQGSSRRR